MSQTAHDSPARNVTSGRLELLRREELNVTHLVHRQADILVPEFGENHGALVRSAATSEADRQVDHGDDGTTQIDQPPHVLSLIHISEPTRLLSISYAVF